jgi:hypothetical protein
MLRDFYIYKVTHKETGEYYIGMRTKPKSCIRGLDWYLHDNYWGSQQGWSEIKTLSKREKSTILKKDIIHVYNNVEQNYVAKIESDIIKENIKNPLNRNYHYDYNGGFIVGEKNPANKRKNTNYAPTSIVFYKDIPYRLNELNKEINVTFTESLRLINSGEIILLKDYIKHNYFTHTKNIIIFGEIKSVLDWINDGRLNQSKFLKSTRLLKWYLDQENIEYRELTRQEKIDIQKICQLNIKKPGTSKYMKDNNPAKRQSVKDKISKSNKKAKNKKILN